MEKNSKIQALIIRHLLKYGNIDIKLPDGVVVEIGVTQEDKTGSKIEENYCWVKTSRADRSVSLDSNFGLNLQFGRDSLIVHDDQFLQNGETYRRLEAV